MQTPQNSPDQNQAQPPITTTANTDEVGTSVPEDNAPLPLTQNSQELNSSPPIMQGGPITPVQNINTTLNPNPPFSQGDKPIKQRRINNVTFLVIWAFTGALWNIIYFLIFPLLLILGKHANIAVPIIIGIIIIGIGLYTAMLYLRANVYRLWDTGHAEPWVLLLFVPIVGFGLTLYLMFAKSQPLPNKHGEAPPHGSIEVKRIFN